MMLKAEFFGQMMIGKIILIKNLRPWKKEANLQGSINNLFQLEYVVYVKLTYMERINFH